MLSPNKTAQCLGNFFQALSAGELMIRMEELHMHIGKTPHRTMNCVNAIQTPNKEIEISLCSELDRNSYTAINNELFIII